MKDFLFWQGTWFSVVRIYYNLCSCDTSTCPYFDAHLLTQSANFSVFIAYRYAIIIDTLGKTK